ncbi:hypothetical protein L6164_003841 [Bauhinia variegata]|uniref:Uncharacterized protein n=1 Tax=Bauhinia variegata TaxID=167791 RepID=A0ACB9Q2R1_BAUVA|nr:hypothetical protein L6164_003841 [Bauhinia variegata]
MAEATKRYAVVTGGNKGIGVGISKHLASNGITVVLTARDEKRGCEAVEILKELALSGDLVFHQLDVNNAAISGSDFDVEALAASGSAEKGVNVDWNKIWTQSYELAEPIIRTNYYGAKGTCQALIPLLQLSDSPRIVNVSSDMGKLEKLPNGWAKEVLSDVENLTEEKIDDVLNQFLKDFKEDSLEIKVWPTVSSAYIVSKAALNAYTRILAKKHQSFCINAYHPGFVKTDMTRNAGELTVDEGAQGAVWLALLPNGGPSGLFFYGSEEFSF